jgi:hypothetical protein
MLCGGVAACLGMVLCVRNTRGGGGITGQKTCILRTDEKYGPTWHH